MKVNISAIIHVNKIIFGMSQFTWSLRPKSLSIFSIRIIKTCLPSLPLVTHPASVINVIIIIQITYLTNFPSTFIRSFIHSLRSGKPTVRSAKSRIKLSFFSLICPKSTLSHRMYANRLFLDKTIFYQFHFAANRYSIAFSKKDLWFFSVLIRLAHIFQLWMSFFTLNFFINAIILRGQKLGCFLFRLDFRNYSIILVVYSFCYGFSLRLSFKWIPWIWFFICQLFFPRHLHSLLSLFNLSKRQIVKNRKVNWIKLKQSILFGSDEYNFHFDLHTPSTHLISTIIMNYYLSTHRYNI